MKRTIARISNTKLVLQDRGRPLQPRELTPVEKAKEALAAAYVQEEQQRAEEVQAAYDDLSAALRRLARARGKTPWFIKLSDEVLRDRYTEAELDGRV